MRSETYITQNGEETEKIGEELLDKLDNRRLIFLYGSLGAGKTTFVKGLCKRLSFDRVTSPSFVLVNIYPTEPIVYHIDLYRLDRREEIESTEIEEILCSSDGIAIVEWAEKLKQLWQWTHHTFDKRIEVYMNIKRENTREIKIVWI